MTPQDAQFYRRLYKLVVSPDFELLASYAKIKQDQDIKAIRTKKEAYEYGHHNGRADAWDEVIKLKDHLIKVMQNII